MTVWEHTQTKPSAPTVLNYDRPGDGEYDIDTYTKVLCHFNNDRIDSCSNVVLGDNNSVELHTAGGLPTGSSHGAYFDGGDYFSIPDNAIFYQDDDWTLDVWIKQSGTQGEASSTETGLFGQHTLTSNGNPRNVWHRSHNKVWYYDYDSDRSCHFNMTGFDIEVANWNHIAYTYDVNLKMARMAYNGIFCEDILSNYTPSNNNNPFYIGRSQNSSGNDAHFNGYMNEFRISKGIVRWKNNFQVYL